MTFFVYLHTAYVGACDDTNYSRNAKAFKNKAMEANIPAITTAFILE